MKDITDRLNELSVRYKIGELQELRRDLRGFKNRLPRKIFGNGVRSDYAFHRGGRLEFQFNIGYDQEYRKFRYGIAFSLETSNYVRDISPLYPKVERFNEYFKRNPDKFLEYRTYSQVNLKNIGEIEPVKILEKDFYAKSTKTFIFIGKFFDKNIDEITTEDCHVILKTFDDLLDVYKFVEKEKYGDQMDLG